MRTSLRKLKLIILWLIIYLVAAGCLARLIFATEPSLNWLGLMLGFSMLLTIVGLIVTLIFYLIKSLAEDSATGGDGGPRVVDRYRGFPVVQQISEQSLLEDGPAFYRIRGVDRQTQNDITRDIPADSAANAKVKAELNGVIVTSVTKIS